MVDLTKDAVTWSYRLLLGREPESEDVVELHASSKTSTHQYVRNVLNSAECRIKFPDQERLPNVWVWAEVDDMLLRVNLADLHVSWVIIQKSMEPSETQFVRNTVKPGDVVVDIGANLGYYTLILASLVGSSGKVFAFEPLPILYDSLVRSIEKNNLQKRVIAFNAAVSDRQGNLPILFAKDTNNWGGSGLLEGRAVPAGHDTIDVRADKLASFYQFNRLNFIKMDVEGAEPLVVRGASDVLGRFRPIILSEFHVPLLRSVSNASPDDFVNLMGTIGYDAFGLNRDGTLAARIDPASIQTVANVVFMPR